MPSCPINSLKESLGQFLDHASALMCVSSNIGDGSLRLGFDGDSLSLKNLVCLATRRLDFCGGRSLMI
jgi:hypothetical protein